MEPQISRLWAFLSALNVVWLAIGIFVSLVLAVSVGMRLQEMRPRLWAKLDKGSGDILTRANPYSISPTEAGRCLRVGGAYGAMWYWDFRNARETVAVWMVAFFVGIAVYTILGLAVTFKTTLEVAGKLRHTLD